MLPTERRIKSVLCVWSSNCYVPSASQVTRMVSWSHNVRASAIEGAWPGPIVAITHPLWHRRPTPGVECPQGLTTSTGHLAGYSQMVSSPVYRSDPTFNNAQQKHIKGFLICSLLSATWSLLFKLYRELFYTHETRLWLSFTTKKPWNKDKVARLVMTIVHCKTEIIDFAAIQN